MKKKILFQKVMGITVTAILTGSTCASPILANDVVIEETEFQSVDEEDTSDGSENLNFEDITGQDAGVSNEADEGLFSDGTGEDFSSGLTMGGTEAANNEETSEYSCAAPQKKLMLAQIDKEQAEKSEEMPELDGVNQCMYTAIKNMSENIKAGRDNAATAAVTVAEAGYENVSYSAEELGVDGILDGETISQEAADAAYSMAGYDPELVLRAIRQAEPDGLSWAEGTIECDTAFPLHTVFENGEYRLGFSDKIQMHFQVKEDFAGTEPYTVDLSKMTPQQSENSSNDAEEDTSEVFVQEISAEGITIKTQPKDLVTKKGETVEFSVVAEGTGLTYQWQYRTSATASWKNFASATKPSIKKVTGDWDGWQVKCVIKDKAGNSQDSNIAKISFDNGQTGPIKIKTQPKDVVTKKGETVGFSVEAEGDGLTYQWQYRTSATSSWKNFASATKPSIQKVSGDWDGWQVRCVIKDKAGNSQDSNIAKISFDNGQTGPIKIKTQPKDVVTKKGETVEFAVEAEGDGLTYQWQYRTSATAKWKNFASATKPSIQKVTGDWDGWEIKCVIKDKAGNSLDSNIAKISFDNGQTGPIKIKTQPKNVTTQKGEMVEFSVEAEGTGLTYQWQYRTDAAAKWRNFSSATTAAIRKLTGDWDGWEVKCVIKDKAGNSQDSAIAKITFGGDQKEPIVIKTQPKDVVTEKGETVEFAVEAEGTGLTYQWKYRTGNTGSWKNFASATKPSIQKVTGDWDGWQVKCTIKDKAGNSLDSDIANIMFKEGLLITKQPQDVETEKGATVEFSVEAEGTGLTYQWQYRTGSTGNWRNFASATKSSIQKVTGDWDGWQVRCLVKDRSGQSMLTRIATIKFAEKKLEITEQPTNVKVQTGETAKFSVKVNKEKATYQWETRGAYQSKFVSVKDATGSSYSVKADAKNNGQVFRCVITDSDGNTVTSEEAVLNIQYQNHTATFVNASTNEIITTAEAEKFESIAGLPAGNIIHLPKDVTEKTSKPYSYYTVKNGEQIPVNLEAVVEGSSASYADLELFFYVTDDVVVYVNV